MPAPSSGSAFSSCPTFLRGTPAKGHNAKPTAAEVMSLATTATTRIREIVDLACVPAASLMQARLCMATLARIERYGGP
jgi:hypothetical protein